MDEDENDYEILEVRPTPAARMNYADFGIVGLHIADGVLTGLSGAVQQLHSFLMMHSRAIDESKARKRFEREAREDIERVTHG